MVDERQGTGRREAPVGKPEALRVRMLGGFSVSVGARTVKRGKWRLRKAASLVKLLSLERDHRMHRERAMDLLWPGLEPKAAAHNLHNALYVARRALAPKEGSERYLRLRDEQITLSPEGTVRVDVEAFEEAAAAARRSGEPAAYRAALELYAGDLLPEDLYEVWAEDRRAQLRRTYLTLLLELAGLYEERKEFGSAIETLGNAVAAEPAHEEAHVSLMRLYALSGRRAEALGQYERLEEVLSRECAVKPDAKSRRLYEEITAGRFPPDHQPPVDSPPEELAVPSRHNLPASRTSFVGRGREVVEIKRHLAMTRLLTLTGAGGSGKTRLALEVAGELAGVSYPDGVWLAELGPLSDPALVPQVVAEALGVREQPNRPLTETLVEALRAREMLLVLDNCEHLVDAAARLADALLGACPKLEILATSREALGIPGEVNWPVPVLSLPEPERSCTVGELPGYESVRLFVERARERDSAFVLTEHNAWAVAEICQRLDGIPLAIELAAARAEVLSVEQISARLDRSLGILTGGRTVTPRQQTLRGALDWSYELLSEPERDLFGRLSAFAGGWTLEAAEAVGAGGGVEEEDVLELLLSLVDKSLVIAEPEGRGAFRYRMLEPVRQYGREKLEEGEDKEAVRRRHAWWYLDLAEEAEPELTTGFQRRVGWLERLGRERDNLRAALSWVLEKPGEEDLGLRLAAALWKFWNVHSLSEGCWWLQAALKRDSGTGSIARAKALNEAGYMSSWQGEYQRAMVLLEESLTLYKELGNKPGAALALFNLGTATIFGGDSNRVVRTLREEAEALRLELSDKRASAYLLSFLGMAALYEEGDHARAIVLHEESLALFREVEDVRGISWCLVALGFFVLEQGEHERAAALLEEQLRLLRRLREKVSTVYNLLGLAGVATLRGEPARAARLWGAAEALREATGIPMWPFVRSHYDYEGYLATARSQLHDQAWDAAWVEGRTMTPEEAVEYALSEEEPAAPAPKEAPLDKPPPAILTRREKEIATLLGRGLTNRRIADALTLSRRTVDNHVANILKKLGLDSRSQIAAWAEESRREANRV